MWEQIRSNRIKSVMLVALMGALLLLLGYFLGLYFFDNALAGLVIALLVWGFMNLIAFFQGDSILLAVAGARKIGPDDHPQLYNVVEEMKIASGLEKMPDIYIVDDPALNAFATGRDANHASVAITSGLLAKLNRDELQGVIGHEMSHIRNRDVLLMSLLAVLLGSIVILAWYAIKVSLFLRRYESRQPEREFIWRGGSPANNPGCRPGPDDTGTDYSATHLFCCFPKKGISGRCLFRPLYPVSRGAGLGAGETGYLGHPGESRQ